MAAVATVVAACAPSALTDFGNVSLLPRVDRLARPDWLTYTGAKDEFELRSVGANDLVGPDGQCAIDPAQAAAAPGDSDGGPQSAGLLPGGIALQMTECDVVRRAGAPENLEVGVDERGERSVVITYTRGPRPGVYRFAAGRLTSVERVPEAPGARAPAKTKSTKKSTARS
ncbi:MAG: hypothetical protein IT536_09965 [Hyphomicrobiales bacterium]|nr:hypothetical protein [Hyphomicrobiales bacterium]